MRGRRALFALLSHVLQGGAMKTAKLSGWMVLTVVALALPAAARGAGGGDSGPPEAPPDPVLERVTEASAKQDWGRAAAILRDALARNPDNPDYHNLYAYSIRKGSSPDMDLVFKHYQEALRLDPKHRGAHEYVGEAYLMVGNVGKAKEHLAALDRICFFGCKEYSDLKREIAAYEAKPRR
jgi:cytochrome c-type biogenesis protein CcmH/NrfG